MDSTHVIGLLLVGISAALLASHWQLWRDPQQRGGDNRRQLHAVRTLRRRTVASSLVGLIGVTLMAFETVPRTPLSITAYLFSLVLMTCWIFWLGCLDLWASRRFQEDCHLEQIADELRQLDQEKNDFDSAELTRQAPRPAGRRGNLH